jgi:ribosomal protein S12 methylthiotransferase accessory factor
MEREIIITSDGGKIVKANVDGYEIKTDQPISAGGTGTAPDPFTLFLASLGACAGVYIFYFCEKRGIPTDKIRIIQRTHPKERGKGTGVGRISLEIAVPDDFPEHYRSAVVSSAGLCQVSKHMEDAPHIEVFTTKPSDGLTKEIAQSGIFKKFTQP